jgi:hypothetical protein
VENALVWKWPKQSDLFDDLTEDEEQTGAVNRQVFIDFLNRYKS